MRRRFLGKISGFMVRTRSYLASDAIEVDEIEGYTGTRKRVLLDEVQLVTLDRRKRWRIIAVSFSITLVFFLMFLLLWLDNHQPSILIAGASVILPFLLIGAVQLLVGVDYVTVFGKRGVAQVAFFVRKKRARAVFALLRERVQEAQAQARSGNAAEQPAPDGSASVA
jgi:hypothetical protein